MSPSYIKTCIVESFIGLPIAADKKMDVARLDHFIHLLFIHLNGGRRKNLLNWKLILLTQFTYTLIATCIVAAVIIAK